MKIVRPAGEREVVEVFLRAERQSARWRRQIEELEARGLAGVELLAEHRGWGRDIGLFAGFPDDVRWRLAVLTPAEVLDILYIHWDWWLRISAGTRRPRVAAERIRAGLVPGADVASDEIIAKAAAENPPLIAVRTGIEAPLVLVEGHVRLTAYALHPNHLPEALEVYVGESPRIAEWSEWQLG